MLPEEIIRDLLEDGGLLGEWEKDGITYPAPKLQLFEFRESKLERNQSKLRGVFIRSVGDSSENPYLLESRNILLGFVTLPEDSDLYVGRFRAQDFYEYLKANFKKDCIHGITPTFTATPIKLDSGRYVFEIELQTQAGFSAS